VELPVKSKFLPVVAAFLAAVLALPSASARNPRGAPGGGVFGYQVAFDFSSGFSGKTQATNLGSYNATYVSVSNTGYVSGTQINLMDPTTAHTTNGVGYQTQLDVSQGFRTVFQFQLQNAGVAVPNISGITFVVENAPNPSNINQLDGNWYNHYSMTTGAGIAADANVAGYGCYDPASYTTGSSPWQSQQYVANSIAIKFDLSNASTLYNFASGGQPSKTGLYANGGGFQSLNPDQDLAPYGINFYSTDIFQATITYDPVNYILTLVLLDTNTGAQARQQWPVNIPVILGGNMAWVGFTGGNAAGGGVNGGSSGTGKVAEAILNWKHWTGYTAAGATYSRLAAPTFSVPAGQYTSTQSVSLSGPGGASIYYTTNGLLPTSASTLYTGTPVSVSSSEVIQAVAIESGYTDSYVAAANYQIQSSGVVPINFPSGFSSANGLMQLAGYAAMSGSQIELIDANNNSEVGAAWYAVPVSVSNSWTANFTIQMTSAFANGMAFVIQNYPPAASDTARNNMGWDPSQSPTGATGLSMIGGGPNYLGGAGDALGYGQNFVNSCYGGACNTYQNGLAPGYQSLWNSVEVVFDLYNSNVTGLYTQGEWPSGNATSLSPVSLNSGHPLAVTLAYNSTAYTLTMTVVDTVNSNTFGPYTWTSINVPSVVGGNTAYVGFTASGGGQKMNAFVNAFTMN
jgi:Chitobiase/beta-hexosaminidase C-terminal domain/Legume lectin domain